MWNYVTHSNPIRGFSYAFEVQYLLGDLLIRKIKILKSLLYEPLYVIFFKKRMSTQFEEPVLLWKILEMFFNPK